MRSVILLSLLVCILIPERSIAQEMTGASITGVVRDSATGQPLLGGRVVVSPGHGSNAPLDSLGRFDLTNLWTPIVLLSVYCPSRTMSGDLLLARRMEAPPGQRIDLELRIDANVCQEPPYREVTGTLRGHFTAGFEISKFSACVDTGMGVHPGPGYGREWAPMHIWADLTPKAWDQLAAWLPEEWVFDGGKVLYVRWHGTLAGPGIYGHLGVSEYEFRADSVMTVRPGNNGLDCRYPDGEPRTAWHGYPDFPEAPVRSVSPAAVE